MSSATTLHSNHTLRIVGNMITVQVVAVEPAAHYVVTLLLALPGTNRPPSAYRPGQFITLTFPTTASTLYRSYSLCGEGCADIPWEITVKRQHAGLVSNYLYRNVAPGMLLQASLPQGRFTLPILCDRRCQSSLSLEEVGLPPFTACYERWLSWHLRCDRAHGCTILSTAQLMPSTHRNCLG